MIDGYMTINEVIELWNVAPRRVRAMCLSGQIDGATKSGREWAISIVSENPKDGRVTTRKYKD